VTVPDSEADHDILLEREERFQGRLLRLTVDVVRISTGAQASREVVHHPGGVGIIPITDDGSVLLVRQYRHPAGENLWEIPAGGREEGESALETARRELAEETGYGAESWLAVGATFLAPGYSTELLWYYRATGITRIGDPIPDPDEVIESRLFSRAALHELAQRGLLRDAKTLAGLTLAGAIDPVTPGG
jgi:ADP-ribose pyrophosphatase